MPAATPVATAIGIAQASKATFLVKKAQIASTLQKFALSRSSTLTLTLKFFSMNAMI
jgi:hypothetical protein